MIAAFKRIATPVALAATLTACVASEPLPPIAAGSDVVILSRDMVLRGVRGSSTIAPALAKRTYDFTCAPASVAASTRAKHSLSYLVQKEGRVGDQIIGMRSSEAGEAKRVNPTIQSTYGCRITRTNTAITTRDPAQVVNYVTANNLLPELFAKSR
ncbi:hypothetical protein [Celeribacter arenosi]|uniref:Lipoprotein n=1 Tax=Celeribacter arenosi TaxID=792649 RepID=A0ABP7K1X8_9RHOB